MVSLLGSGDELLHVIEREFDADIHVRGNEITATGNPAETALVTALFDELVELLRKGTDLTADAVERTAAMLRAERGVRPADVLTVGILSARGRTIRPKTLNQKRYADAIDQHTIVFAIGPAGTGKTYLAMAKAVKALQAKEVNRIILTRPAVEAGERLGFLPGTLYEKIDPYLRPLYDALHDMLDPDSIPRLMTAGTIEIAPLAYMRGRAQPVDTPVLTPDGFRPIGSLTVGDLVIGSNGEPTPVIGVYPQGEKDIYRVTAQDGASTLASGDHLWAVATRDDRRRGKPLRVLTTREMIGNLRANHYHRYELPLHSAPVRFPYREVPMDPYALGLLLGDGCLTGTTTPSFATGDPELAWELQRLLPGTQVRPRMGPNYMLSQVTSPWASTTLVENPVTGVARRLGLHGTRSTTKFVPDLYLYNSAKVRLAVLQGLLDTDGGPVTQRGRTCRVQYSTTSPRLRDDVIFLVRSLGGVAYHRARPAAGRAPGIRQRTSRLSPPRRVHHRHPASGRHRAVPPHPEARRVQRRGWRWASDALHREHRAGRHRGGGVHLGGGGRLPLHDRGLPADAQHPERLVHHPGRGAEHHGRTDEDVPHPARFRLAGGSHRRRDPGRPANRPGQRAARGAGHPRRHRGHPLREADQPRCRKAPAGGQDRRRVRALRRPRTSARPGPQAEGQLDSR